MSAKTRGRADAAKGDDRNPYRTDWLGDRPSGGEQQRNYDEWQEGYEDKKREMDKKK